MRRKSDFITFPAQNEEKASKKIIGILKLEEEIFEQRLKLARTEKSPPISIDELEKVLSKLKTVKSRDPKSWICDIFKEGVIGTDLKLSLLMMFNKMKDEVVVPELLRTANITSLHKKNCKLDLNNWRGIFVSSVLRTVFVKINHERTYETVTSSMTDSQIGARKKKM